MRRVAACTREGVEAANGRGDADTGEPFTGVPRELVEGAPHPTGGGWRPSRAHTPRRQVSRSPGPPARRMDDRVTGWRSSQRAASFRPARCVRGSSAIFEEDRACGIGRELQPAGRDRRQSVRAVPRGRPAAPRRPVHARQAGRGLAGVRPVRHHLPPPPRQPRVPGQDGPRPARQDALQQRHRRQPPPGVREVRGQPRPAGHGVQAGPGQRRPAGQAPSGHLPGGRPEPGARRRAAGGGGPRRATTSSSARRRTRIEESLRKRVGRWLGRYPEVQEKVGTDLAIADVVEAVFLNAFEGYDRRPRGVRLGRLAGEPDRRVSKGVAPEPGRGTGEHRFRPQPPGPGAGAAEAADEDRRPRRTGGAHRRRPRAVRGPGRHARAAAAPRPGRPAPRPGRGRRLGAFTSSPGQGPTSWTRPSFMPATRATRRRSPSSRPGRHPAVHRPGRVGGVRRGR